MEMQTGTLIFKNSALYIMIHGGTEHAVAEDDYVECLQNFSSDSHTFEQYCPLNQQYADGVWYFDRYASDMRGLPVRFRKAEIGERKKRGTLSIKKSKLEIELWSGETQEIESGTKLELNLPHDLERFESGKTTKCTWQRCRVELDASAKKWVYFDIYERAHILILENDTLARIAV